ncbi:unnamed protein product [Diplocarpon coronariae]
MSTPKNINFKPPADPLPESFQARPSHSEIDSDSENSLEHLGPCIRPGSPPVETNKAIMAAFKAITNHFPLPGSPGAPYFTGANITDFLEQYEETCYDFGIGYDEMINRLPRYCDQTSKDIIRDTLAFLKEFVLVTRTPKELKNYCRTFTRVSNTLINQKILSEVERGRLFLLGLPTGLRNKIIKHFKVDERDPVTYAQFEDFSTFALKADLSERTIEAMEKEKEPTSSFTKDLKSLVQEHSKALEVTEEAKRNPVVIPFTRGPGPGAYSCVVPAPSYSKSKIIAALLDLTLFKDFTLRIYSTLKAPYALLNITLLNNYAKLIIKNIKGALDKQPADNLVGGKPINLLLIEALSSDLSRAIVPYKATYSRSMVDILVRVKEGRLPLSSL